MLPVRRFRRNEFENIKVFFKRFLHRSLYSKDKWQIGNKILQRGQLSCSITKIYPNVGLLLFFFIISLYVYTIAYFHKKGRHMKRKQEDERNREEEKV